MNYAQRKTRAENKLDRLNRALVYWRDVECVEKGADGKNCGGGSELGHIIRRSDSAWLKRLYWNLVRQCHQHNVWHGDPLLHQVIGPARMMVLRAEMAAHRSEEPELEELERRIAEVQRLLDRRPSTMTPTTLWEMGYFGPTHKEAQ